MSFQARAYTRALKRYDKDLFCAPNNQHVLCVFRKHKRFVPVVVSDDFKLLNLIEDKQFVFSLTDTWTLSGKPRAWGIDRVLDRLREIDLHARERLIEEMDALNERVDESKSRDISNELEAFASDYRGAFKKATDDILIHSLSKDEPRKRMKEKRIKNGNY
jgi:hypothetical protein